MNKNILFIFLSALVSAALFAVLPLSFGVLGFLLFFAYLPIFCCGLHIHASAALLSGLLGATLTSLLFNGIMGLIYYVLIGFPAALMCYLVLQSSPINKNKLGLGLVGGVFAALLAVSLGVLQLGEGLDKSMEVLFTSVQAFFEQGPGKDNPTFLAFSTDEKLIFFRALSELMPALCAFFLVLLVVSNFDLASRLLKLMNLDQPAREPLYLVQVPLATHGVFLLSVVGLFLGDYIAFFSFILLGALMAVYTLVGLGIIHALTLGLNWRSFMLGALYFSIFVFQGAVFILCMVALADVFLEFRKKLVVQNPKL